jgi:hypothetical protein
MRRQLGDPRNWRTDREELVNPEHVPDLAVSELAEALGRARAAGATGPLEFVGVGMFGIVLCDREGKAWKVFRIAPDAKPEHLIFLLEALEEEFEWLTAAAGTEIAPHVARVFAAHPEELVLERECVPGESGSWYRGGGRLSDLHSAIEAAMLKVGWTGPEFKDNSYIIRPDGQAILVDVSMPLRVGTNLADWVGDILEGRRRTHETWHSLAFYVLREMRLGTVPEERAKDLVRRLNGLDPSIAEGFALRWLREEGKGPAMAGAEEYPWTSLYELGNELEKAGIRVGALRALNFPKHKVGYQLILPPLDGEQTAKVLETIRMHGMAGTVSVLPDRSYSVFFVFERQKGKVVGDPHEAVDLLQVMNEIRDAGFWVFDLHAFLHEPPPFEHTTFEVTFQMVSPYAREQVEKILERNSMRSIGGGTSLGPDPASDVGFMFATTREAYRKKSK